MFLRHAPARARHRLVLLLVAALVATLPSLGLGAVTAADAADPVLSHVATSSSAGNRLNHTVQVPAAVQAGDTLVLFMTANSLSGTVGSPAGWTLLRGGDGTATRGRAWTKQATAADAGANVTVTSTTTIKDTMTVSAYRSNGGTSSVTASAQVSGTTAATTHTSPAVAVAQAGSWLVNSWSEKSSTDQTWTAPTNSTSRANPAATGSGKVSSLVADSNGPVATGTAAGRAARTSASGSATQLFSVVISPGTGTGTPVNQAPVASFTATCSAMTCNFDASGSSDPDNDPLTYAWSYGDGTNGTGVTASRTYTTTGSKTVTLTVGDGKTTTQTTRTASPTNGGTTTATLSHVGAASSAGNRTSHSVRIPSTVQAGDVLVLFMTVNSLSGTLGNPTGWTALQSKNGTATRGRAWTKRATAADANALVSVASSSTIKDTMSVAAYRSTGTSPSVTASAQTAGTTSTTSHTSPSVAVTQAGSWLVNSWSEKSSTTQTWTRPSSSTTRANPAATGSGKISSLMADSNAAVATGTAAGRVARTSASGSGTQLFSVVVSPGTGSTTPPPTSEPLPNHAGIVPQVARTDMPRISNGEIFDIEVVGNRVFVAGTFTSIQNQRSNNTASYAQAGLASYNLDTGLVDTSFRPDFAGADLFSVEATPDGTKLYAAGTFTSVNGVARRGLVRLDPNTGAPVSGFTADTDARVTEIAATNSTVYLGGRFIRVNGVPRVSLAAVDAVTGAVDTGFVNDVTSGIGVNGGLTVQKLLVTHDGKKLLVVHTGRRVAGQERLGIALIDTATKQLLPWRTRLWDDNLQFVGGVQRIFAAAIAPDDSYFVVTSGSGGDRPPINDTAVAYSFEGGDQVEPKWVSRAFDSVYSVAISEKAVYLGGHFQWNESPTAPDPWPGQDDIGYGTGQGLSAYSLGDGVVNREHLGALNPVDGKAVEWDPGSNSYEGNKAMVVTPRGLITGGDATTQGGSNVGRLAFFDFDSVTAPNGVETEITEPIMGRVLASGKEFSVKGTASATGGVNRVEVEIQRRDNGQYLQDNLTSWGGSNTITATLANPGAASTSWSLALTIPGNVKLRGLARTVATSGTGDASKAVKNFETFGLDDAPPTVSYSAPASGLVRTKTFTVSGTTADDRGVVSLSMTLRDDAGRYLQGDGTADTSRNTFRIVPDVPGATSSTWSREFTVPTEGNWRAQIRATDTGGQSSLDTTDRTWTVTENGQTPTVAISAPGSVVPPTAPQPVTVQPGGKVTFSGTATDDGTIKSVYVAMLNNSTGENLTTDGTWGIDNGLNLYKLPAGNVTAPTGTDRSYRWTWTTPQNVTPGNYTFAVLAEDNDGMATPQSAWALMTMNAVVNGDQPPKALIAPSGTQPPSQSLSLNLTGTATDDQGVAEVRLVLKELDTSKYLQPDGTVASGYASVPATVASPNATSTAWSRTVTLPVQGNWNVTAYAVDTAGQRDLAATGATARYPIYPGDTPPEFNAALLAPTNGTTFQDGKIFVSGRAEDDQSMAKVEVAIVNSAGRYLSSSGTFGNESWRTAFLTSPGTPGSNFSYTTPVVPPGDYTVKVRAIDQHDLVTTDPPTRTVTVTHPPGNAAPVAVQADPVCTRNVCQFDARGSTDENATTLTYAWNFGNGTGAGPNPKRTYTAPGSFTVTLTATDEWGVTSAVASKTVTISEPADNAAPEPVINQPACAGLTCNFSAVGTVDPNTGDTVSYAWSFGDPTTGLNDSRTGSSTSHVFSAPGTYTVTLIATDGWGRAKSVTRQVTVTAP